MFAFATSIHAVEDSEEGVMHELVLLPQNLPLYNFDDDLRTQDYEGFYASVFNVARTRMDDRADLLSRTLLEDMNTLYGYEMAVHTVDHNASSW